MGNNTDDRWLSRQELADRFGLPVKTLAQWASKGTGPHYARMGRHARYRLSDVIDWETTRFGLTYSLKMHLRAGEMYVIRTVRFFQPKRTHLLELRSPRWGPHPSHIKSLLELAS